MAPLNNSGGYHNSTFVWQDITSLGIEEICRRIQNGFDGLYVGNYFDIYINSEYGSESVRCVLAEFDTYRANGDTPLWTPHAVIVTKNCLTTLHQMNEANTTEGGFVGSDMWQTVIPAYTAAFEAVFGSYLLTHRTLLTNSVNEDLNSNAGAGLKGASDKWGFFDTKLSLLSEVQVYGCNVCSSSFYDTGLDNLQLQLFTLDPTAKVCGKGGTAYGDRQWYWLRNVASTSNFASAGDGGSSGYGSASIRGGVRPIFCIG